MNRERSQVWIFTIMIIVLILMLFCPVVFGQVSRPLTQQGNLVSTILYNDGKTPLYLAGFDSGNYLWLYNSTRGEIYFSAQGTDTSGQYLKSVAPGAYFIEVYYNRSLVARTANFTVTSGNTITENVTTSRAPTGLITIDSFS